MNDDKFFMVAITIAMPFACFGGQYIFSFISGWASLAKEFSATEKPTGNKHRFHTLTLRGAGYPGITYCLTDSGLYIAMPLFLKLFHPPLLIPWDQFYNTSVEDLLFGSCTITYIGSDSVIAARMPPEMAEIIQEHQQLMSTSDGT